MWFTGDFGTGKTTLAMLISKTAMERDHTVAIYSLPRLLTMLRETFRDDSPHSLSQLMDKLCSVDLLHIDDVGAEQTTSWVLEQLYTVVNTRYEDRALADPDHEPDQAGPAQARARPRRRVGRRARTPSCARQIGERTVSRLYEMCGDPLPMFGDDRRLEKQFNVPVPVAAASTPDPFDDARWDDDSPRYGQPRRSPYEHPQRRPP